MGAAAEAQAKTLFPVTRIRNMLRQRTKLRVGAGAALVAAQVMEYITGEVLSAAQKIKLKKNSPRERITGRRIYLALRRDTDLEAVCPRLTTIVREAGGFPHIHQKLLRKDQNNSDGPFKAPRRSRRKGKVGKRAKMTKNKGKKAGRRKSSSSKKSSQVSWTTKSTSTDENAAPDVAV